MRATAFEFRYRFFITVAIFAAAFGWYRIDPRSAAQSVGVWLVPALGSRGSLAILWLGTALTLAGAGVRTWASAYLGADVVGDSAVRSENLVANGPYRYVRNPLYVGLILLAAGMGVTAPIVGWGIAVVGTTVFLYRLLRREEAELSTAHNASYDAFVAKVPRLLPALTPRVPAGAGKPRWGQAFRGEIMMWCFSLAMVTLSLTLNAELFRWLVVASFVVYGVTRALNPLARASGRGSGRGSG